MSVERGQCIPIGEDCVDRDAGHCWPLRNTPLSARAASYVLNHRRWDAAMGTARSTTWPRSSTAGKKRITPVCVKSTLRTSQTRAEKDQREEL